jgi:hypothetical protein
MTGSGVLVAAAVVSILIVAGAWVIAARRRPDLPVARFEDSADTRTATGTDARPQDPVVAAIARSREARGLPPIPRRDPRGSVNAPPTPASGAPAGDGARIGAGERRSA